MKARRKVPPKNKLVLDAAKIKKENTKKGIRTWLLRMVLAIVLLCIGVGFWYLYQSYRYFVSPLNTSATFAGDNTVLYEWDESHQLVVGLWLRQQDSSLYRNAILVIEPAASVIDTVFLPSDISVRDAQELANQVGLPIDRYLVQKSETPLADFADEEAMRSLAGEWQQQLQGFASYFVLPEVARVLAQQYHTNLSPQEVLSMMRLMQRITAEDITFHHWPQDTVGAELLRNGVLVDNGIVQESLQVWVRNTTQTAGLGSLISEWAYNLGFEIVRVNNADCTVAVELTCDGKQTLILTRESNLETWSIKRLEMLLDSRAEVSTSEDLKRADVIILVGEDLEHLVLTQ
jgi:hypothetical protein